MGKRSSSCCGPGGVSGTAGKKRKLGDSGGASGDGRRVGGLRDNDSDSWELVGGKGKRKRQRKRGEMKVRCPEVSHLSDALCQVVYLPSWLMLHDSRVASCGFSGTGHIYAGTQRRWVLLDIGCGFKLVVMVTLCRFTERLMNSYWRVLFQGRGTRAGTFLLLTGFPPVVVISTGGVYICLCMNAGIIQVVFGQDLFECRIWVTIVVRLFFARGSICVPGLAVVK